MLSVPPILHSPFLIVGAGPAGLIAGIELQKSGFKTQIIERLKDQQRTVCGEYLSPQGVGCLEQIGLADTVLGFHPVLGMVLYSSYETEVTTSFPGSGHGVSLNRTVFQKRLVQKYESLGGIIHYDNLLEALTDKGHGYEVTTSKLNLSCEYLIGADGRQSRVAKLLNFASELPVQKRVALHCYLKPKFALPFFGQMHILPDGSYVGINPINSNEVNFSIVTNHDAIKEAGGVKELINFWIKRRKDLNRQFWPVTDEEIKTASPITRKSSEIVKRRVALIGDASGFVDPLTGEGITTAVKTASLLAQTLKQALSIESGLIQYERRRKHEFREKEKLNMGFQKLIQSPLGCELLGQVLNMSKRLRNTFIGVIGNVYTPTEGLKVLLSLYLKERV